MQDLQNLPTSQLVDLLAEKTTLLTAMFAEKKFDEEYEKQKLLLKAIQTEIDFRKTMADITPTNNNSLPDFIV
jgi:hypothetical protein